jgi:hypothetical protein
MRGRLRRGHYRRRGLRRRLDGHDRGRHRGRAGDRFRRGYEWRRGFRRRRDRCNGGRHCNFWCGRFWDGGWYRRDDGGCLAERHRSRCGRGSVGGTGGETLLCRGNFSGEFFGRADMRKRQRPVRGSGRYAQADGVPRKPLQPRRKTTLIGHGPLIIGELNVRLNS